MDVFVPGDPNYEEYPDRRIRSPSTTIGEYCRNALDAKGNVIDSHTFTDWKEYVDAYILKYCSFHKIPINIFADCKRVDYEFNWIFDLFTNNQYVNMHSYNEINKVIPIDENGNDGIHYSLCYEGKTELLGKVFRKFLKVKNLSFDYDNIYNNPVKLEYKLRNVFGSTIPPETCRELARNVSPFYILASKPYPKVDEILEYLSLEQIKRVLSEYQFDKYDQKCSFHFDCIRTFEDKIKQTEADSEIFGDEKRFKTINMTRCLDKDKLKSYVKRLICHLQELEDIVEQAIAPTGFIYELYEKRFISNQNKSLF